MIGYDASWASFHIVEVMSQQTFRHKRIGYLAAEQVFKKNDPRTKDFVLLSTNLLKKQLHSKNPYAGGLAVNCISNIVTKDLARDLLGDVTSMLESKNAYLRKKGVLVMYVHTHSLSFVYSWSIEILVIRTRTPYRYKLYLQYPHGLRLTFEKLRKRLEDPSPSVVCGAVNVICELARKNPKNYLPLAPQLFKLLTSSSNNWMLIKVVKLLGELVSEEPRLARKILEPLSKLIRTTSAKSLLYECVRTVTRSLPYTKREDGRQPKILPQIVKLCMSNLKSFVEDSDQNLKYVVLFLFNKRREPSSHPHFEKYRYLGLAGLKDLMSFAPQVVKRNRNLVLECLQDPDISIRLRALDLLEGIVSKENLVNIVDRLSREALETEDPHYRDEIVEKVVTLCSKDKFKLVQDFAWYVDSLQTSNPNNNDTFLYIRRYVKILVNLVRGSETKHADAIATQLTQVSLRVPSVRSYLVKRVQPILTEGGMMLSTSTSVESVLYAAAWDCGRVRRTRN